MALRPHCLKCGSTSVVLDRDVENGCLSAYCYICGNRQYQGTDYRGFELREENMARGTCKNCQRRDMTIVKEGLCWSCATASNKHPDPGPERDAAMSRARNKAKSLPGPHRNKRPGPALEKTGKSAGSNQPDPVARNRRKKRDTLPPPPSDNCPKEAKHAHRQTGYTPPPNQPVTKPVLMPNRRVLSEDESDFSPTIEIRFTTPEDRKIYDFFQEHSRKMRRSPDQQILFMISAAEAMGSFGVTNV